MTTPTPRASAEADIHAHATFARGPVGAAPSPAAPTAGHIDASALRGALDGTTRPAVSHSAGRVGPTCPVTVYVDRSPGVVGSRGGGRSGRGHSSVHTSARACGEPVDRGGLCEDHADDRDRLGGAS